MMYVPIILVLLPAVVFSTRAFPIRTEEFTEEVFREISTNIKWDDDNYLVDEAGPYAICENRQVNGELQVTQKPLYQQLYGNEKVVGQIQSTRTSGTSVGGVRRDIETIVRSWVERFSSYRSKIEGAKVFGCAVEPACPAGRDREGREIRDTLVACLFSSAPVGGGRGRDERERFPRQ